MKKIKLNTGGKWFFEDPKYHKMDQLLHLQHPCEDP